MTKKLNLYVFTLIILMSSCSSIKNVFSDKSEQALLLNAQQLKFSSYFYEALNHKESGRYDEALETFRMCYSIDSLDAGLLTEMSTLYSAAGINDEALRMMETACKYDSENWWLNRRLINLYTERKDYDKALNTAKKLQKVYPTKEEIYQILAALYTKKELPEKAIDVYNQLEKITGIEESLAFQKFYLYAQQNKVTKAISEIDRLVNKFPANSRYKVIQGDVLMQQKMPEKAYEIYKNVLLTDPDNPYVYLSLSEYYQDQNQPDKAIEAIEKALKNPNMDVEEKIDILGQHVQKIISDSTRFNETDSLFKLLVDHYPLEERVHGYYSIYLQYRNRIPEALNSLESMININPKNQQSWLQMIQLNLGLQDINEVIINCDRAINYLPEVPQFYFFKTIALFQNKKYQKALETINLGLSFIPENQSGLKSDFYAQIGDIEFKLENDSAAFSAYDQALIFNPSNVYVMNNYAYYLSEINKDLKKAEFMSAKTVEKEPSNSTFLDTYAWIFYKQENFTLAKFYIEKAIDSIKDKENPGVIYEHYGDILWKKGDSEKALKMWQKALESGNENELLKEKIENKSLIE